MVGYRNGILRLIAPGCSLSSIPMVGYRNFGNNNGAIVDESIKYSDGGVPERNTPRSLIFIKSIKYSDGGVPERWCR